jgi:hypothetical protein
MCTWLSRRFQIVRIAAVTLPCLAPPLPSHTVLGCTLSNADHEEMGVSADGCASAPPLKPSPLRRLRVHASIIYLLYLVYALMNCA